MKLTRAVPFMPTLPEGSEASGAAEALTAAIRAWKKEGWDFCRIERLTVATRAGCLYLWREGVTTVQLAMLEREQED